MLSALPRAMLATLVGLGYDAEALRRGAAIDLEALADPDGRVPLSRHLALWEGIAAIGPTIGLELGKRLGLGALGLVGFVIEHRTTIGEALADLARFRKVVLEDAVPRLERRGARAVLAQEVPARVARLERPVEAQAAATFTALRRLAGDGFALREVSFPHRAPASPEPWRETFGLAPRFGAARTELVFDAAWLERKNLLAHPALAEYLSARATELARSIDAPFVDRVNASIAETLAEGPTPRSIARALGTSSRTLQRRLGEEGHTFAALLDRVRHERALALLADRSKHGGEIAFLLGFREPSTFSRAFRRWTGTTPKEHRARTP